MTTKANNRRYRLIEIAAALRDEIVPLFSKDEPKQCELCGAKETEEQICDYTAVAEHYQTSCQRTGCDGELRFWRLYVEVGEMLPASREQYIDINCSEDCGIGDRWLLDICEAETSVESETYEIPMPAVMTNRICEHHTSYQPERTIPVCASCHAKIHQKPGFRADLEPEMKRTEWEAAHE